MASPCHDEATVAASAATPAARLRELNDALRQSFSGGRIVITSGVAALSEDMRTAVLAAVQAFDRFDADNDPYGEHDFGAVEVGVRVFWKIDYFDRALSSASPDPANSAVTCRVLTVMLAEEY
jgi:hypothetical protein